MVVSDNYFLVTIQYIVFTVDKVFELVKDAPHSTFGLKLTISNSKIDDAHYDPLPKDDSIKEIEKLSSRKINLETMGEKI